MSFSGCEKISLFAKNLAFSLVYFTCIYLVIHRDSVVDEILMFGIFLLPILLLIVKDTGHTYTRESAYFSLYIISAFTSLVITIDTQKLVEFGYMETLGQNQVLDMMLDIRYIIGILVLLCLLIDSIIQSIKSDRPSVPSIKIPNQDKNTNPNQKGIIYSIIKPLFLISVYIIKTFLLIADLIWRLCYMVLVYLFRISKNFYQLIYKYLFNIKLWKYMVKISLSFISLFGFVSLLERLSTDLLNYVITSVKFNEIKSLDDTFLDSWFILYIYVLFMINIINWVLEFQSEIRDNSVSYGVMLLFSVFLSGLFLYVLSIINIPLVGFETIGIFSFLMLALILIMLPFAAWWFFARQ